MKAWFLPATAIVAVEYLVALAIEARIGFAYSIPFLSYFISALTVIGIAASIAICIRLFNLYRDGEDRPTKALIADLPRFAPFAFAVLLVALSWAATMWLKVMLPLTVGFWADQPLADLDALILGADAWILAHWLFWWTDPVIDQVYASWAPVKFVVLCAVILAPEGPRKTQALISYFLCICIGLLAQYALPSAGPIFFALTDHGARFADLPVKPWAAEAAKYLWADYLHRDGKIGGGISAMPSIHVVGALWIALVVRSYLSKLAVFGFAFFAFVLIGSVYLGWHYALDGIAGAAITGGAWYASGRWARFSHREEPWAPATEMAAIQG
jgi:hypothetical protein